MQWSCPTYDSIGGEQKARQIKLCYFVACTISGTYEYQYGIH